MSATLFTLCTSFIHSFVHTSVEDLLGSCFGDIWWQLLRILNQLFLCLPHGRKRFCQASGTWGCRNEWQGPLFLEFPRWPFGTWHAFTEERCLGQAVGKKVRWFQVRAFQLAKESLLLRVKANFSLLSSWDFGCHTYSLPTVPPGVWVNLSDVLLIKIQNINWLKRDPHTRAYPQPLFFREKIIHWITPPQLPWVSSPSSIKSESGKLEQYFSNPLFSVLIITY